MQSVRGLYVSRSTCSRQSMLSSRFGNFFVNWNSIVVLILCETATATFKTTRLNKISFEIEPKWNMFVLQTYQVCVFIVKFVKHYINTYSSVHWNNVDGAMDSLEELRPQCLFSGKTAKMISIWIWIIIVYMENGCVYAGMCLWSFVFVLSGKQSDVNFRILTPTFFFYSTWILLVSCFLFIHVTVMTLGLIWSGNWISGVAFRWNTLGVDGKLIFHCLGLGVSLLRVVFVMVDLFFLFLFVSLSKWPCCFPYRIQKWNWC